MSILSQTRGPKPRALIVEDDPFLLLDMEDMLGAAGVHVTGLAVTKTAALNLIQRKDFDIATIDYDLAGETSEEVAALLEKKDIPFILVSSMTDVLKDKPIFKNRPALEKPVSEKVLTKTIRNLTLA